MASKATQRTKRRSSHLTDNAAFCLTTLYTSGSFSLGQLYSNTHEKQKCYHMATAEVIWIKIMRFKRKRSIQASERRRFFALSSSNFFTKIMKKIKGKKIEALSSPQFYNSTTNTLRSGKLYLLGYQKKGKIDTLGF